MDFLIKLFGGYTKAEFEAAKLKSVKVVEKFIEKPETILNSEKLTKSNIEILKRNRELEELLKEKEPYVNYIHNITQEEFEKLGDLEHGYAENARIQWNEITKRDESLRGVYNDFWSFCKVKNKPCTRENFNIYLNSYLDIDGVSLATMFNKNSTSDSAFE